LIIGGGLGLFVAIYKMVSEGLLGEVICFMGYRNINIGVAPAMIINLFQYILAGIMMRAPVGSSLVGIFVGSKQSK
jgi:hypothetical protein